MKIPLLDLKAQYQKIKGEVNQAVTDVLESQHFILGPKVSELEEKIAAYSDTRYAVGVSSGSDALLVCLMALDIQPDDEVITSPFTFFSTAGVISRMNATPVFVDIDPVTYNIDPAKVESALTRRTKAMIPVHLYGQCADMDPLIEIAKKYNIAIIEDAAQSIGAQYKGKKAGSMGDMGTFSFFPSKNLGGFGDGGMVVTNDESLYKKLRILRIHGGEPKYYHKFIGGNFRLDALQAAVLIVKLKYLDEWSEARRHNAVYYNQKLLETGLVDKRIIELPASVYENSGDKDYHIYNQYTIRAKHRDRLRNFLRESDIGTEIYYPLPLHLQECFKELGYLKGDFPEAELASNMVLSLPIYPELSKEQKDYAVKKIKEFY